MNNTGVIVALTAIALAVGVWAMWERVTIGVIPFPAIFILAIVGGTIAYLIDIAR